MLSEDVMPVDLVATALVAGLVGVAILGHLVVVVAVLRGRKRRPKLEPQS
jgi:hypothetical protein